jgi:hypothetical protein
LILPGLAKGKHRIPFGVSQFAPVDDFLKRPTAAKTDIVFIETTIVDAGRT